MSAVLASWQVKRLTVPLGRVIGDNNCAYDAFDVCLLRLETRDGIVGWGIGEKAHGGTFRKPVSWKSPMPDEQVLVEEMDVAGARLREHSVDDLLALIPRPWEPWTVSAPLHAALRMALWDLKGRTAGQPLWKMLTEEFGGNPSLSAYASPCAFPQSDKWVEEFFRDRVADGFRAVKVKVGHPDTGRDMTRLLTVRDAVGPGVEMAVDANTAWDAEATLRWLDRVADEGLALSYVEDPASPDDLPSYRLLAKTSPVPVVGHDYIPNPANLRPLLETGALSRIRLRDGIDYAIAVAGLAEEFGLRMIQCNTFGEHGLHFALAHPGVERIEYARLGWNALYLDPVQAVGGRLIPPDGSGLGLVPCQDKIAQWHAPTGT